MEKAGLIRYRGDVTDLTGLQHGRGAKCAVHKECTKHEFCAVGGEGGGGAGGGAETAACMPCRDCRAGAQSVSGMCPCGAVWKQRKKERKRERERRQAARRHPPTAAPKLVPAPAPAPPTPPPPMPAPPTPALPPPVTLAPTPPPPAKLQQAGKGKGGEASAPEQGPPEQEQGCTTHHDCTRHEFCCADTRVCTICSDCKAAAQSVSGTCPCGPAKHKKGTHKGKHKHRHKHK